MSRIHPQARTTPRTRAEIKASASQQSELAERDNTAVATARKWKKREVTEDLSHRPHKLSTALTAMAGSHRRRIATHAPVLAGRPAGGHQGVHQPGGVALGPGSLPATPWRR